MMERSSPWLRWMLLPTAARARRAILGRLVASVLLAAFAQDALASEIRLLSANVFTGVLDEFVKDFERSSGHKVTIAYGTAGNIKGRVQSGEPGDVAIITRPMMEELERSGKIRAGTTRDIARSAVALIVRSGAGKPDIATIDAFRRVLLAAGSVSYPDPSRGGATGVLSRDILKRLGLTDAMAAKTRFPPPGHFAVELVAKGEAEVAIAQPMEALLQPGVEIVGPLPKDLQDTPSFTFTIGQMASAKEPDAVRSLMEHLVSPHVQSALRGRGMEPGTPR